MKYIIKPRASRNIYTFYQNVAKKYLHTYDKDDLKRNVYDALQSITPLARALAPSRPRSLVASRPQPRGKTPRCFQVLDIALLAQPIKLKIERMRSLDSARDDERGTRKLLNDININNKTKIKLAE